MLRRLFTVLAATAFWALLVCVLWVLLLLIVPPPVTWEMVAQAKAQGGVERTWVPLSKISPAMPLAVIAAEDQKFFDHFGFDMEAMRKAMAHNDRSKRVRGASTISQQTAKNVFLWPGRNFVRKGLEAWFTLLMETFWSKDRILEMYLNVAETGKGRFGAEATAQHCFKRSASKLTDSQAALIAAVLPSPRRFNACSPSAFVQRRQAWILRQMRQLGNQMDPLERERLNDLRDRREKRHKR
ncbi:MAG: monofunctional biosynthetic peptidoglycan transglycosylase [Flavobacteriales bacterium]|nr:monofunctional biosynthetic peptidoglycan transglycosylase [Flavobacteriales bacterium]